jgi:hypothetical protein
VIFFEPELIPNTVIQRTHNHGNTSIHVFIILSVFPLPCSIAEWALQWGHTRIILLSLLHRNLPSNCLFYAQLQIILLNSQKNEGSGAAGEFIGSLLNKLSTPLALLVHLCETEISVAYSIWPKQSSLSKRTNGGDPLRWARNCSLKTLSISALRRAVSVSIP